MSERAKLLRRYAANYEEMFSAFYKALDANPEYAEGGPKGQQAISGKSWIKSEISWAKQTFESNNAWVTWWLRWVRLTAEKMYTPQLFGKDLRLMQAKNPEISTGDVGIGAAALQHYHRVFEHLMATPAPELAAYRPEFKTITAVKVEMGTIEKAWQEEQAEKNRSLKPQDGDEIVIQFPDGWAWWKLNRHSCSAESEAMGHCGNSASSDESQRILSLRQAKPDGGWSPHLTFILESDGFLGEMKGRNNDKPVQRYHKYILALLENPIVKGIRGGGYMPSHNFAVTDLTPEEQDTLYEKRPDMMPIPVYYKKFGVDETFVQKVINYFEADHGETVTWNAEHKKFVTETWPSVQSLVEDNGNDDAKYAMNILSGDEHVDWESGMKSKDELESLLDDMPKEKVDKIGRIVIHDNEDAVNNWLENNGYDPEETLFDTTDTGDIASFVDEEADDTDLLSIASQAYSDGMRAGAEEQIWKALKSAVEDSSYYAITPDSFWDSQYAEMMSPEQILTLVSDEESIDSYHRYNDEREINVSQPYYGWSDYDEKAAMERFDEEYDVDEKFAEVFGAEGVAAYEQEKAQEKQYTEERSRLLDEVRTKFKDASPQVRQEFNDADQEFRNGNYGPLVKMLQAVIPGAFPFATSEEAQPEPVPA